MSGTQVRICLVDTGGGHTVRQSALAGDAHAADALIVAWLGLGSSLAGRTEVVARVVPIPARLEGP